jgi:hypothetical protein
MKHCLTLLAFIICLNAIAQVRIKVSNPEPHVGQKFTLEFSGNFLEEYLIENLPSEISTTKGFAGAIKEVERTIISTKQGKVTIGPFKIKLNGKRYKTNSIVIDVQPALEPKEGFWIRRMTKDDEDIILLEQIIKAEPIREGSPGNISISWKSDKNDFAGLIEDTDFEGIHFEPRNSGWGGTPNELIDWPNEFRYSYKFYRIVKSDNFKKPLELNRQHFENLKDTVILPKVVIN